MRFEHIDERHADHRNPLTWSLLTGIRPRRQERMVSMSQAYSMRKRGDSAAEIAREVEASRSTVRDHLVKDGPTRPKHPSAPRSRSEHQHTRLGNRDACAQHRPGPKHTLDTPPQCTRTPLTTSGRFRRPNLPETPPNTDVFPGRQSRQ